MCTVCRKRIMGKIGMSEARCKIAVYKVHADAGISDKRTEVQS